MRNAGYATKNRVGFPHRVSMGISTGAGGA